MNINIKLLYYKKYLSYIKVLKDRFHRRIANRNDVLLAISILLLLLIPMIIIIPLFPELGTLSRTLFLFITQGILLFSVSLIITLSPDILFKTKKDILKLNRIVVSKDLVVSRAYNFIDMEHSTYEYLNIRLPKDTKFLEDFIETEILKHDLNKEDIAIVEQDLKQNCNLKEYNYLDLKKIVDTKFSILEYEKEKRYILNKLEQDKRVSNFRRSVFDRNKKIGNDEPLVITKLKEDTKAIEVDELQYLKNLNRLIDENENIVSNYSKSLR